MVGTSVPVPGILSHDISFHTHLPGLSIVLGFNLQHRMGRWSQEGSVRHVGGSPMDGSKGRRRLRPEAPSRGSFLSRGRRVHGREPTILSFTREPQTKSEIKDRAPA